jgi:hypothetical protein
MMEETPFLSDGWLITPENRRRMKRHMMRQFRFRSREVQRLLEGFDALLQTREYLHPESDLGSMFAKYCHEYTKYKKRRKLLSSVHIAQSYSRKMLTQDRIR